MALESFVSVGCSHGDMVDQKAKKKFFEFVKAFKPKHRFHLGDAYDFRSLRRGADPKEEGDSLEDDWAEGNRFLDDFRPTIYTLGNHDGSRLWRAATDWRGIYRSYAEKGIQELQARCKKNGTTLLPYHSRHGVYKFGDTNMMHGYHAGIGATREHARIYRKCQFAHLHRVESCAVPGLDDAVAQCIGSLANFEAMDYASQRTATLAWRAGWSYGYINTKTDRVTWWMAVQQDDGSFLCPTGFKQY